MASMDTMLGQSLLNTIESLLDKYNLPINMISDIR